MNWNSLLAISYRWPTIATTAGECSSEWEASNLYFIQPSNLTNFSIQVHRLFQPDRKPRNVPGQLLCASALICSSNFYKTVSETPSNGKSSCLKSHQLYSIKYTVISSIICWSSSINSSPTFLSISIFQKPDRALSLDRLVFELQMKHMKN